MDHWRNSKNWNNWKQKWTKKKTKRRRHIWIVRLSAIQSHRQKWWCVRQCTWNVSFSTSRWLVEWACGICIAFVLFVSLWFSVRIFFIVAVWFATSVRTIYELTIHNVYLYNVYIEYLYTNTECENMHIFIETWVYLSSFTASETHLRHSQNLYLHWLTLTWVKTNNLPSKKKRNSIDVLVARIWCVSLIHDAAKWYSLWLILLVYWLTLVLFMICARILVHK